MCLRSPDRPATAWLVNRVGQDGWQIKFEKAVAVAEGVDAVELVADDANSLRKMQLFRVTKDAIANEFAVNNLIAMDAEIAEISYPERLAVETDRIDPSHVV